MGNIWVLVLVSIMNNGEVNADLQFPLQPIYNSEQSCKENGLIIAKDTQAKIGLDNGNVYYQCQPVDIKTLLKGIKLTAS